MVEKGNRFTARDITIMGILTAILFVLQIVLAPLPNIEVVSLLVMLYTLHLGYKTLPILYVFALLQGLVYGFHLWWICYLYVWTVLFFLVMLAKKCRMILGWALLSGGFGLLFGALCAIPYIFTSGLKAAFAWFVAGAYFDILHCVGNFFVCLVLFKPLDALFAKLLRSTTHS